MRMSELHADYVKLGNALERVNKARMSPTRRDARIESITQERAQLAAEMGRLQDEQKQRIISRGKEEAAARAQAEAVRKQAEEDAKAAQQRVKAEIDAKRKQAEEEAPVHHRCNA